MARAKSAALARLVERNLSEPKRNSRGELKRKKLPKSVKKARHRKRQEAYSPAGAAATSNASESKPKTSSENDGSHSAELTEIENLKKEIARELGTRATYVKRQRREEAPVSWAGLTPGLAPVGYDPDESDSEDDPY